MAGLSSFIYGGDESVDPFGSSNSTVDPFGASSNSVDPFAIPVPSQPNIQSFDPFANSSNTNDSIPPPVSFQLQPSSIPPVAIPTISSDTSDKDNKKDDINEHSPAEEDELKTEFNIEPKKSPRIAIETEENKPNQKEETTEEQQPQQITEEQNQNVMITEVEDQANQKVINYFQKAFSTTFVPQLKETETEVNELIQIQGLLDNQLKVLYDKLKEMERILSPPSYIEDLNRIIKIQKRIDRINAVLTQIETRITVLMSSRIYMKYSSQITITN
ncbi:hypothetical protein ENUP19_0247G0016 [Entamoeba nuttalli]|uniref:Uncharacterized protein n=2 Tax=Entamoeba nuttalli TaxID=412467 RepID=K2H471_ENTNP|nr:hypothetical protein ENU1_203760 [Entamoeba nuttalli P19]EKE37254.1 hypothetical protein ENU1_203760 [Entamoeba nuttalli P19]|eukprot:XP_008860412.1 hypothetical protein ENU1_203760 [Entamoeba nuttalli P19]